MKITYRDGRTVDAILLVREGENLRVAIDGADDTVVFSQHNGIWVSDDCEPVHIEHAWECAAAGHPVTEEDCCCSPELAARLIHLLYTDSSEDEEVSDADPVVCAEAPQAVVASKLS